MSNITSDLLFCLFIFLLNFPSHYPEGLADVVACIVYSQCSTCMHVNAGNPYPIFARIKTRRFASFLRLKWDRWALADRRDLPDPLVPSDSSVLVVTPEIRDRSDSADPVEPLDPPDLPEKR